MVHSYSLDAQLRPEGTHNRGSNRRLRRAHQIPGVIYGKHLKENLLIALDEKILTRSLADEAFHSHLLTITVAGQLHTVVLRATQRKHGKSHTLVHVDFQEVDAKERITMYVPLHLEGLESCDPVVKGKGIVSKMLSEVHVRCLPSDLPEFLTINLAKAQLHDAIHLSDIALPHGVEIMELSHGDDESHDLLVLSIHEPKTSQEAEAPAEEAATPAPDAKAAAKTVAKAAAKASDAS